MGPNTVRGAKLLFLSESVCLLGMAFFYIGFLFDTPGPVDILMAVGEACTVGGLAVEIVGFLRCAREHKHFGPLALLSLFAMLSETAAVTPTGGDAVWLEFLLYVDEWADIAAAMLCITFFIELLENIEGTKGTIRLGHLLINLFDAVLIAKVLLVIVGRNESAEMVVQLIGLLVMLVFYVSNVIFLRRVSKIPPKAAA